MKMNWSHPSVTRLIEKHGKTDPIEIIRELARSVVLQAFNNGWQGPPFDPIQLAQLLKIDIIPNEDILEARTLTAKGGRLLIEYNPYQRETRLNFSIAHEIGHTLFPDCHEAVRNREEKKHDSWELEFLCDIAGSEILLPYAEFSVEANTVPLKLQSLLNIANKYKASIESVFLRFCDVTSKPCSVILASFKGDSNQVLSIDYHKSSRSSVLPINQLDCIPEQSHTYQCINPGWTSKGKESWEIFGNTAYSVEAIGLPPIKKQKNNRVGIFIFPEFYKEEDENELMLINGDATKPRGNGPKIIAQVINTSGGLGFGFGRAMAKSWPSSKQAVQEWMKAKNSFVLGSSKLTKLTDEAFVFQMIAQKGIFPKNGEIPLRYDALRQCLMELSQVAGEMNASVHMPKIGAGQAKGDWKLIEGLIRDELISRGIKVLVYMLPGTHVEVTKNKSNLSLFDDPI